MKIFDMHIHNRRGVPDPERLLQEMAEGGVWGGCVFSDRPFETNPKIGVAFEQRLEEILAWTNGYEDRLFPVLWIHPREKDIAKKIRIAAEQGICAFKLTCPDYYVYEKAAQDTLHEIAATGKPAIFHTGILWDGSVSSAYNRPLHWESLLPIEGLRFSMGHCSWPWVDECIALYGKFLHSLHTRNTAEMFFDITPGTPEIYREELLRKLYTIGYDVGDNIMFGTDTNANRYNSQWAAKWLKLDGEIMDTIGVSAKNRQKLYYDNLLRFLGKSEVKINRASPECDDAHAWDCRKE